MVRAAVLACAIALVAAPSAWAHAQLEGTVPARGAVLQRQPAQVVFRFDEPVEARFGALRVFDARGDRVDDDKVSAQHHSVGIGLRPDLPRGTYTATYRIVSADGHPVSGGVVFSLGAAGAARANSVDDLLGDGTAGTSGRVAGDVAHTIGDGAIALAVGLLAFLLACWRPALRSAAGGEDRWAAASAAFAGRARRLLLVAVGLGALASLLTLVAEGAVAGGTSLTEAARPSVVREVAATHVGHTAVAALLAWLVLGAATVLAAPARAAVLRPVALGAAGQALERAAPGRLAALALPSAVLVATPAVAGHAWTQSPRVALLPLDALHVGAMAAWLGGLAALLALVPAATHRLEGPERTRLLAAVLLRFSPIALGCVVVLLATGSAQALIHLGGLHHLVDSTFGVLVLVKVGLLGCLVALGAVNRQRVVPRLRAAAACGATPAGAGVLLRRTLRAEVALVVAVLGVTGVLVSQAPPTATAAGPQTVDQRMGPLHLTLTVDPARAGRNELHLYLFTATDGRPFAGTKELTATASLPAKGIPPLPVTLRKAGPGHYVADALPLQPAGTWQVAVVDRVGDFDQYATKVRVRVR